MKNSLWTNLMYSLIVVFITIVLFLISCTLIKFDYSQVCQTVSANNSYSIVVSQKTHNLIKTKNITKINGDINERKVYFNLYYQTTIDQQYVYWINSSSASFYLDPGTYSFSYNFCQINFISYIF